jgi:hypothetical protein
MAVLPTSPLSAQLHVGVLLLITDPRLFRVFSQLVNGLLTTLCVVLGTCGNVHSVRSLSLNLDKRHRGVVLAVSVLALAAWDTVLLWSAFFYYSLKALTRHANEDLHNLLTPFVHPCSQIANTASVDEHVSQMASSRSGASSR